ncbi:hypothetical protein PHYSODRAFT_414505, partial [Phytophthora sojae]
PRLDRLACLWVGKRRWSCTRREIKQRASAISTGDAVALLTQRVQQWNTKDPVIHQALSAIPWQQIRRWPGLDAWGGRFLYRLKTRGIKSYDRLQQRLGCPHTLCV